MKRTHCASRAPGSWSVGMIRAVAASIVSHWWSSKNSLLSSSRSTGDPMTGQSALLVIASPRCFVWLLRDSELLGAPLDVGLRDVFRASPGVRHDGQGRV